MKTWKARSFVANLGKQEKERRKNERGAKAAFWKKIRKDAEEKPGDISLLHFSVLLQIEIKKHTLSRRQQQICQESGEAAFRELLKYPFLRPSLSQRVKSLSMIQDGGGGINFKDASSDFKKTVETALGRIRSGNKRQAEFRLRETGILPKLKKNGVTSADCAHLRETVIEAELRVVDPPTISEVATSLGITPSRLRLIVRESGGFGIDLCILGRGENAKILPYKVKKPQPLPAYKSPNKDSGTKTRKTQNPDETPLRGRYDG